MGLVVDGSQMPFKQVHLFLYIILARAIFLFNSGTYLQYITILQIPVRVHARGSSVMIFTRIIKDSNKHSIVDASSLGEVYTRTNIGISSNGQSISMTAPPSQTDSPQNHFHLPVPGVFGR